MATEKKAMEVPLRVFFLDDWHVTLPSWQINRVHETVFIFVLCFVNGQRHQITMSNDPPLL